MTALILLSEWQKSQIEFWRRIKGYKGYEVSSFGRVRNWCSTNSRRNDYPHFLCTTIDRKGYESVALYDKRRRKHHKLHRLVLAAFADEIVGKDKVNHLNGCKADNRLGNLEWVTQSENLLHCHQFLNPSPARGERHASARLDESAVYRIRILHEEGWTQRRIARKFGVSHNAIGQVIRRQTWSHVT